MVKNKTRQMSRFTSVSDSLRAPLPRAHIGSSATALAGYVQCSAAAAATSVRQQTTHCHHHVLHSQPFSIDCRIRGDHGVEQQTSQVGMVSAEAIGSAFVRWLPSTPQWAKGGAVAALATAKNNSTSEKERAYYAKQAELHAFYKDAADYDDLRGVEAGGACSWRGRPAGDAISAPRCTSQGTMRTTCCGLNA